MLAVEQIETVLISTSPEPTGHERIVAAFRDGDDLYIPLDSGRAANSELLTCDQIYVRRTDAQNEYSVYVVNDHRVIDSADRRRLEACLGQSISETTEVVHLAGSLTGVALGRSDPAGFVAVIDGSERALRALAPAAAIADWYGRPLQICAVTAGQDDHDTRRGVEMQIEDVGLDRDCDLTFVAKADLDARLLDLMRQGQIPIASAFGVWAADGRLHGMVNGLVRHNAPAIIGIGPKVPTDWEPSVAQPLVVFVDATEHAHDIVDRIDPFLTPPRGPLMVVHVTTEDPPNTTIAADVAAEIQERCGLPVQSKHVEGRAAAEAIATVASTLDAQMAVLTSWHRPEGASGQIASTSLSSVAQAACPVVILSPHA